MGRQLSPNPTAGTNFGGFSSRQVPSSYSPSYIPSSLASAFLPAAINLNFHLSQMLDVGFIENRILRRALSTTLLGGGVTLSYYASGLITQRLLEAVDKSETSLIEDELHLPSVQDFKWHIETPAGPLSTEDLSTEICDDDPEHENLAGKSDDTKSQEQPFISLDDFSDDYFPVFKPINGARSIFVKYLDTMKPIQTQLEAFATSLISSNSRNDHQDPLAFSWSVLAIFVGLYYMVLFNRRQYQASLAYTQIPQAVPGDAATPLNNANYQSETLGTACTKTSLRIFLSARGVPLKLPLFAHNGKLLFTLDEVAFRDSRLDPYGTIIKGGSGSPGAKAALLDPTGVDYTELCFRLSGINPNQKQMKPTPGSAPRLTSLATIACTELEQSANTSTSLRARVIASCGWLSATLVKLIVGFVVLVIISVILVMSLPLQLVAFFFFTQAIMEIDEKVQDGQINGTDAAHAVMDARKRLDTEILRPRTGDVTYITASPSKLHEKSKPSPSKTAAKLAHTSTVVEENAYVEQEQRPHPEELAAPATISLASASTDPATSVRITDLTEFQVPAPVFQASDVLDLGELVIPIGPTPAISVVPATPTLDPELATAVALDGSMLSATFKRCLVQEDLVGKSTEPTGGVSVSVDQMTLPLAFAEESASDVALTLEHDDIYEEPVLESPRADSPVMPESALLVDEPSNEDITAIASSIPEAFAGFDATILVSGGSRDASITSNLPILKKICVVQMQELDEVDRNHLSALSALELATNGKNVADRQKLVDDVVEAHIKIVEERANRTLATSMWSDIPSGSFQSNAQLLSSDAEHKLPRPAFVSVVEDKANNRLGEKITHIHKSSQPAQTKAIELAFLPIVNVPVTQPRLSAPKASSSSSAFSVPSSSAQAGPSTTQARMGKTADESRGQTQRGGHRAGVGRRWGAPVQAGKQKAALAPPSAAKKRMVDTSPVPDWAKA